MSDDLRRARWRLVMGQGAEQLCGGLSGEDQIRDQCLNFLYGREYGGGRNVRAGEGQQGGLGESVLTVPDWINHVHNLFPKRTIERLEQDALERPAGKRALRSRRSERPKGRPVEIHSSDMHFSAPKVGGGIRACDSANR